MNSEKLVRDALHEIELRHYEFFKENNKSIVDYVEIHWTNTFAYLKLKDNRLPITISIDLEEIFEFV
jgi:hypothetical protein